MATASGLTAAQNRAVSEPGPLIVGASAGSGKTRVLVERYVRLLLEGCDVHRMIAMTFTRKAAAEMLDRIARRLEHLFASATDPNHLRFLRTVRERLVSAQISTFHAYCSELLRRFPIEAGIPPVFGELSAAEQIALVRRAIRTTVEEWIASHRRSDVAELLVVFGSYAALERTVERLLASPERVAMFRAEDERMRAERIGNALAALVAELASTWRELERRRRTAALTIRSKRSDEDIENLIESFARIATTGFRPFHFGGEWAVVGAEAIEGFHTATAMLRSPWSKVATPAEQRSARRSAEVLRAFIAADGDLERRAWAAAELTIEVARQALKRMDDEKTILAAFEPDDLQRRAVELVGIPAITHRLRREIEHILVDEFQDTDPLEYDLLRMLVPLPDISGDVPELFIVGDPKQSIYGFRGADVRVFERARQDILAAAGAERDVRLQTSFRMTPTLVAVVNTVMRAVMPERTMGYAVGYEELCTARQQETCPPSTVALLVARSAEDDWLPSEAELVARHIVRIVSSEPILVWDEAAGDGRRGAMRPARYRDIALLARKSSTFESYVHWLRTAGIPFRIESGKGFYQTQEVLDVLAFLRVVHNPHDDVALATFLRSPFVGLSDSELALVATAEPRNGTFYQRLLALVKTPDCPRPAADAVGLLDELIPLAATMPPTLVVRMLLRRTQWYRRVGASSRARQIEANIEKLLDAARQFEQRGFRNLLDFVEELAQLRLVTDAESEAAVISDDDAVTLMTIHAAKGLEFPIVYLVGASDEARGKENTFVWAEETGPVISTIEGARTAAGQLARYFVRQREEAEEQRLLYVALTRAKDHLFVAGTLPAPRQRTADAGEASVGEPKGYFGAISSALGISWSTDFGIRTRRIQDRVRREPGEHGTSVEVAIEIVTELPSRKAEPTVLPTIKQRVLADPVASRLDGEIVSASQLLLYERSPEEFYRVYRCGLPARDDDYRRALAPIEEDDRVVGTLAGRIIHRTLELLLQREQKDDAAIEEAISRALEEHRSTGLSRLQKRVESDVRATLDFLRAENMLDRIVEAHIERPMIVPVGNDFLLGIPDVLVRTADGWEIWDWKTNRHDIRSADEWLAYYRTQLEAYVLLSSLVAPEQPSFTVRLILTRPPVQAAQCTFDRADLRRIELRIANLISAIKRTAVGNGV